MYTLWSLCKDRYFSDDHGSMKEQTANLTANARTSLAKTVAQTLAEQHPSAENSTVTDVGSMEDQLQQIEAELLAAEERLAQAQKKEDFVSKRIQKYQQLLLRDDEEELSEQGPPERSPEQQAHHQQQLDKQKQLKHALGDVIDVHLTMMKNIKLLTREVTELEQKKYHLRKMTQECRDFLVMAEEAERPMQLYQDEDGDDRVNAMEAGAMEMAPLSINSAAATGVVERDPIDESHQSSKRTASDHENDRSNNTLEADSPMHSTIASSVTVDNDGEELVVDGNDFETKALQEA